MGTNAVRASGWICGAKPRQKIVRVRVRQLVQGKRVRLWPRAGGVSPSAIRDRPIALPYTIARSILCCMDGVKRNRALSWNAAISVFQRFTAVSSGDA